MNVDIDLLEVALRVALRHVRAQRGTSISVPDDLYWFIQKEELNNPDEIPKDMTLGSLADDLEKVSSLSKPNAQATGYHLIWLSSVLRALGERVT